MTLVSHDHRFIFLKTRKTAGTSAEMYLQPFCTAPCTPVSERGEAIVSAHGIVGQRLGRDGRKTPPPPGVKRDTWFAHHAANGVRAQLPRAIWRDYEKITAVRNPYRKVLSSFFWQHRRRPLPADPAAIIERFRAFVNADRFQDDRDIVFVRGALARPKYVPDTVLRAERLIEDLEALAKRLGLDTARTELPVTKSTQGSRPAVPTADFYDEGSRARVRRRLDWMFDAGGYDDEVPA